MHMADALVSPAVAAVSAAISAGLLGLAASKIKKEGEQNIVPLMGVMGAFIFAAQMINFSIPGTGSSGHIIGGVLLGAMLGPWAALLTLASVLTVQCLLFADGGLMAIGCNILNMGVCTTLIAYPLVFRPIMKQHGGSLPRILAASVLACVVGLELGALLVTAETELSGITALPTGRFLAFMTSIHLFIGIGEGIATAAVVYYVARYNPSLLEYRRESSPASAEKRPRFGRTTIVLCIVALILASTFTWIASSNPDGLEWSLEKITGSTEIVNTTAEATRQGFAGVQTTTSLLPDYDSTWSGIIGCTIVVALVWALTSLIGRFRPRKVHATRH